MRLLQAGITVARTADDLIRYHDKFLIVDRRELFLLSFNFTHLDIDHSRCFGLVTTNPKLVAEAVKLFEADTKRQPYVPGLPTFVVSPVNARKQLAAFLKGAKKELLIYDPEISDPAMLRLLDARAQAGVNIKVIGRVSRASAKLAGSQAVHHAPSHPHHYPGWQPGLHRKPEPARDGARLPARSGHHFPRQENRRARSPRFSTTIGMPSSAPRSSPSQEHAGQEAASTRSSWPRSPRRWPRPITKDLPPVAPVLRVVVRELVGENGNWSSTPPSWWKSVEDAVKEAVKEAVRERGGNHRGAEDGHDGARANP